MSEFTSEKAVRVDANGIITDANTGEEIDPVSSNSSLQVLYISEGEDSVVYTYRSSPMAGSSGFVAEGNYNVVLDKLEEGNYKLRTITHSSNGNGVSTIYKPSKASSEIYTYAMRNNVYGYLDENDEFVLDILGNNIEGSTVVVESTMQGIESLLQETSYTSGDGNYYKHTYFDFNGSFIEAYVNMVSGATYALNGDEFNIVIDNGDSYVFGTAKLRVPDIAMWNTSTTGLSTLYFENDLGWLK